MAYYNLAASAWHQQFYLAQDAFSQAERAWLGDHELGKGSSLVPSLPDLHLLQHEIVSRISALNLIQNQITRQLQHIIASASGCTAYPHPASPAADSNIPYERHHIHSDPTVTPPSTPKKATGQTKIVIQSTEKALAHANRANDSPETPEELVLWTDASQDGEKASNSYYAVATKRQGKWHTITEEFLEQRQMIQTAELRAIGYAVEYATKQAASNTGLRCVRVFTDSQSALRCLRQKVNAFRDPWATVKEFGVRAGVQSRIRALEAGGVKVELHWVPRGKVEGNKVADRAARQKRKQNKKGSETNTVKC